MLFLASIPFTGLHKFWNSGVPATPMLLVAGAGAILLANTVFAESREARSTSPILRGASLLLVAVILPLAAIAALSIGMRINQYGWTPERIWGVIAAAVAIAYGLAGWFAIWKGRQEFDEPLRPLQAALAVALCGVALFLALPIVDFGAISARSQMARLDSGKVTAAQFDWAAMAFDFGRAGRDRLDAIARGGPAEMRSMAVTALKSTNRWEVTQEKLVAGPTPVSIDTFPKTATVPAELEQLLLHGAKGETAFCSDGGACRVYPQANGASYVVVMDGCANLPPASLKQPTVRCARTIALFEQQKAKWTNVYQADATDLMSERTADLRQQSDALARGDIRIVPVERRQIMIGGEPVGTAF